MKIWIVDDDEIFQMVTRLNLQSVDNEGEQEIFTNGRDPLDMLNNLIISGGILPDIILLDINMPIYDGWSFLKSYALFPQNIREKISIYVCSSSIDPKDREAAASDSNVITFVEKPLDKIFIGKIIKQKKNNAFL